MKAKAKIPKGKLESQPAVPERPSEVTCEGTGELGERLRDLQAQLVGVVGLLLFLRDSLFEQGEVLKLGTETGEIDYSHTGTVCGDILESLAGRIHSFAADFERLCFDLEHPATGKPATSS